MRFSGFLFFLILSFPLKAQQNPFLALKFDKVIMYDFTGGKGSDLYIVDEKDELAKSISKQIQLDKATIAKLNEKLGNKKSYGAATAFCFDPHLGFVYYLKGKIVGHITICLDCNRLRSSISIAAQQQGKIGKGKDAYYISDGLSIPFRNFLNSLLVKNNFSHQISKK
jgi:hypothetical protein